MMTRHGLIDIERLTEVAGDASTEQDETRLAQGVRSLVGAGESR